jgi:nucleoside-triphosphatase THEP1
MDDAAEGALERAVLDSATPSAHLVVLTRPGGVDGSETLLRLVAELRRQTLRVGGFLELPSRSRRGVQGYDLRRVSRSSRIPLARRVPRARGANPGSYSRFSFRPGAFARAFSWLQQDVRRADVLMIDGISSLEAQGGGHLDALAWACQLREAKVLVVCVRSDQLPTVLQRLGLDASALLQWELSHCDLGPRRAEIVGAIVQLARHGCRTSTIRG